MRQLLSRSGWFILVFVGLGAAATIAELAAARIVDADFVEERLSRQLGEGGAEVSVGETSFSLFRRRLEMREVVVSRVPAVVIAVDRMVLAGLPFLGWEDDQPGEMGRLTVERPLLFYSPPAPSFDEERGWTRDTSSAAALRVGALQIERATVLVWRDGAEGGPRSLLVRDIELNGRDVSIDPTGRIRGSTGSIAWRTGPVRRVRADGLTEFRLDSMRASSRDSSILLYGGRYQPVGSDEEFLRRLDWREDRIRAIVPHIELRGVDFGRLPPRGIVARTIRLDSVDVDVLTDRRIPARGGAPWLPHSLVQSFEGALALDSVRVRGRIQYADRPAGEGTRPGRIAFADFDGRILGISNEPGAPPMVITATTRLFDAPVEVRLEVPLEVDRFFMSMEGRVGPVDLDELNSLTVPLEGVEFQAGRLEGVRFDIDVDGPSAGGTVWAAYHDLDVQLVDRRTGEGGLFDDIKSFLANNFVFRGDNMPDVEGRTGSEPGAVEYYVPATDPFFSRIWGPIRSGLMAIAR